MRFIALLLSGAGGIFTAQSSAIAQSLQTAVPDRTVPAETQASLPESSAADIIVTAQKRSERLNDVPISITAVGRDQLAKQGITSPADLAKVVPGFTYQYSTFGPPVFTIRGIGLYDTSTSSAPTVSVYVDQIPLPYLAMTQGAALDLERVEVLKGPQGTLFGQNSTGGAVNYIAAKPTDATQMGFDLTYGRFNQVNGEAFVSGALTDTLRIRVAARHEYRDAWQRSETRPGDRLGVRDFSTGRVLIDWTPTSRLTIEIGANGWIDHSDTQAAQFITFHATNPAGYPESQIALGSRAAAPADARVADWDPNFSFRRDGHMYQFTGRADYQLSDEVTITSLTAYSRYHAVTPIDVDGTDFNNFRQVVDARIHSFSQELRLAARVGKINVTAGGNYERDATDEANQATSIASNTGVGPLRYVRNSLYNDQRVRTYAGFLSADLPITAKLTAQAGVRYTKQDRAFAGCLADAGDGAFAAAIALIPTLFGQAYVPAPNGGCVTLSSAYVRLPIVTSSLNQHNLSWRAGLNWKPAYDALVYANVTRGYKAGGYSLVPGVFADQFDPVTQEKVTAYELGAKGDLLYRRVNVSSAIFYYDYVNKQIQGVGTFPVFGTLPQLVNIPKSRVYGAELELTLRPVRQLRIKTGVTYVNSRVQSHFLTPDPFGTPVDVKGEAFPNTPRWQATGDAEYDFAVSSSLEAFVGANASYRSASNAIFGENAVFRFKPYALVDARLGIGSKDGHWQAEIWGRNVFNTFYWNNVAVFADSVSRITGMPATYGVTLRSRF